MFSIFRYPIVVLAFNRPEYFRDLLSSLKSQSLPINSEKLIFCLDGYANSNDSLKGHPNYQPSIRERIFENFPDSPINSEELNIGIARMHHKALKSAFLEDPEWALVLEDDVVLIDEALYVLQELILQDTRLPGNTGIINLDCWKRIDFRFRTGNFVPSHGTRAFLISRKFYEDTIAISDVYLEYFSGVAYQKKDYESLVNHMLPTKLLLPGSHSDEFYSSLVDFLGYIQFAPTKVLAEHKGLFGENATGKFDLTSWTLSATDRVHDECFSFKRSDLFRIRVVHFLTQRFGLNLRMMPLRKIVRIQGIYKTSISIILKFVSRVVRLIPF